MPYCENDACFQAATICPKCNRSLCAACAPSLHGGCASVATAENTASGQNATATTTADSSNNSRSNNFSWESLFPELLGKDGARKPATASLSRAEVVGVYFSAHWCPPCRGFTPVLANLYKQLVEAGKAIEIVFVSSDKDEDSFQKYYDSMPWLALPFSCRAEKQELSKKYEVSGIPTLVLLSPTGETISTDGRELVDNWGAKGFPYTSAHLEALEKNQARERNEMLRTLMGEELKLLGEEAWGPKDSRVKLSDVAKADVIGLVFGDRDNMAFTQYVAPALKRVHKEVREKHGQQSFELIFLPWEGEADAEEDKSLRESFPFVSLDYSTLTPEVRDKLQALFTNITVPGLALIRGNGSEVLSANAVREVYEAGSNGFPWTKQALEQLEAKKAQELAEQKEQLRNFKAFENKLIFGKDGGEAPSASALTEKKMVGLYFSAHWCGPCRAFTPRLITLYNELKSAGNNDLEIIFISSDRDQEAFNHYYSSMPWLALSFSERDLKSSLSEMFGVEGIPTLIFLDGTGKQLNVNGRAAVSMGAEFYPWDEAQTKRYSEVAAVREAERKAQAEQAENKLLEEQKAQGNGVIQRLRGKLGVSKIDAEHKITFGSFDTFGAPSHTTSKGKVFYEVEILDLDEGIQQFGWADEAFQRVESQVGEGTGDDEHSWGADGARVQRWHDGSTEYGQSWSNGDVLGCAANLDDGEILFGLNGNWESPMGVAFSSIKFQGGLYPSLTANSGVFRVNLGGRPFKHGPPNDTYVPVVRKS